MKLQLPRLAVPGLLALTLAAIPQTTTATTFTAAPNPAFAGQPVTLTAIQGDNAVIASGLTAGQQVVVDGQGQLRPGARVVTKPAPVASVSSGGPTPSGSAAPRTKP